MNHARILVVEDDRVVARDLRQQLGRLGYDVVGVTARGEEACALALSTSADLALMDIRLEGRMDGIDAAREIRLACDIPVVFLTAYADDETLQRAGRTEPHGYLLKPFEDSQLRTAVEMALYRHAADRKLRHSERRYAATLASIGDAVISTDSDSRITYLNPVAESLTGCRSSQVLGFRLDDVYRLRDEETGLAVSGTTATVQSLLLECDRRGPVPIEQSASPIVDDRGHVTGTVLVFRDLSHRRSVEKALRDAQAELARVSGLTTMGELAASIAHEINQPLAAIVTNASAGLNWLRRPQPELVEIEQVLDGILSDANRATGVIRSLQSLACKSGPEPVRLDLHTTIHEVMALMRSELQRDGVRVRLQLGRFDSDALVLADRIQVQQVLVNLLRNGMEAIKASADPACLLTIATEKTPDGEITTSVTDTGDGIPPQHLACLFDAFFTTKPAGMGMGLAICRSIVEAHHGRLWAQPLSPRGTRMVFSLPAADGAGR